MNNCRLHVVLFVSDPITRGYKKDTAASVFFKNLPERLLPRWALLSAFQHKNDQKTSHYDQFKQEKALF
jgi:hypothetical protein